MENVTPPAEWPSDGSYVRDAARANDVRRWRYFGTIGFDAYLDWVQANERASHGEPAVIPEVETEVDPCALAA